MKTCLRRWTFRGEEERRGEERIFIYTYIYIHTHATTHTYMYLQVYKHLIKHLFKHLFKHFSDDHENVLEAAVLDTRRREESIYMYMHTCIYLCTHTHTHMYIYTYIYIYIYTCIHTYIYTYRSRTTMRICLRRSTLRRRTMRKSFKSFSNMGPCSKVFNHVHFGLRVGSHHICKGVG